MMPRKNSATTSFDPMNIFNAFNPAKAGEQFTRMFGELNAPAADMDALITAQRKTFEAAAAANQAAFDGVRTIAERQAVMARESVDAASGAVEALRTAADPREAMEKQAEFARCAYDKAVKDASELRELAVKTGGDVVAPISAHIRASFDEFAAMTALATK